MRPKLSWPAAAVLGAVALIPYGAAAAASAAYPAALTASVCKDDYGADFDGDGRPDVAVGVPGEDRGTVSDAGAVEVRYLCGSQTAQALVLPRAHAHDRFGTALAVGTLNGDRYLDLAVGVPGLDVHGHRDAGGVALFYGSAKGLRYAKTLTQASAHVGGSVQANARFGQTLSITGDQPDRLATLRIGEPGRTVAGHRGAGGYVDHALRNGRYVAANSGQVTLATPGVPGSPRTGDALGAALYSNFRVGIPHRTVNGAPEAGAVLITPHGRRPTMLTQASPGVPGTPEPGDHFGASLAQGWVGVPGESVGSVARAGIAERPASVASESVVLDQHDADPSQVVEAGDRFGAALTETGVVVDDTEWSPRQLLVGAPGQDVAGHADAGTVSVVGESSDPDGGPFVLGAPYGELQPAKPVTDARFGSVLGRNGLRTVQVGAVGAAGGQLSLFVAPGRYDALPTRVATLTQVAGTPESGDRYGGAVALSPV
jgi:hypothetical protein